MVPTALRVPRYSRHMTQSTVEPLTDPPARVYRSGTTASFMDALTALYIFLLALLEPTNWWFFPNYLFVIVLLLSAFAILYSGRVRNPRLVPGALPALALLVWLAVCAVLGADPARSAHSVRYVASVYGIGFILVINTKTWRQVRMWLGALALGCLVLAIATLVTGSYAAFADGVRTTGVARQENALGQAMTAGVAVAVLAAPLMPRARRLLHFVYIPILLAALLLSGSRGAAISALTVLATFLFLEVLPRVHRHVYAISVAAVVCAAIVALRPEVFLDNPLSNRIQDMVAAGGVTTDDRWGIYVHAWRLFLSNPVTGVGLGNYQLFNPAYVYTHSAALELLVGAGVVGALLYYLQLGSVMRKCLALARTFDGDIRRFFNAGIASISGVTVQGAFSLVYQNKLFTVVLFLTMGAVAVAIAEQYPRRSRPAYGMTLQEDVTPEDTKR